MRYKHWTNDEDRFLVENAGKSNRWLAEKLGRTEKGVRYRLTTLFISKPKKEYAIYRGDELLGIGTMDELSKTLGISVGTLRTYVTPSKVKLAQKSKKRLYGVKLDESAD